MLASAFHTITTDFLRQKSSDSWSDPQLLAYTKVILHELIRETEITRKLTTITQAANVAKLDMSSITDFRVDLIVDVRLVLNDRGTWATSTSYTVDDMVQGDGDPDTNFYKCIEDHTSAAGNEPPNTTYWTPTRWKGGEPMQMVDYDTVADLLDSRTSLTRSAWFTKLEGQTVSKGTPLFVAFETKDVGWMYPVTDRQRYIQIRHKEPLVNFATTDTPSTITLNIDDEFLFHAARFGMVSIMHKDNAKAKEAAAEWKKYKKDIKGRVGYSRRRVMKKSTDATR